MIVLSRTGFHGVQRAVFTALARAGGLGFAACLRFTGAGLPARALFTLAGVLHLFPWTPYRGAVAGRMCGPHLPLLDLRAAGFGQLPAFFGSKL